MTDDEPEGTLVYACSRADLEQNPSEKPIGRATSEGKAARMMNKFLSQRDGYDPELKGRDIYYSRSLNAFFTEE